MPDIIDDAQAREAHFLAQALDRARAIPPEPGPLFIGGVACCRECEEPILSARFAALPGVGLCRACAEELIQITGGW